MDLPEADPETSASPLPFLVFSFLFARRSAPPALSRTLLPRRPQTCRCLPAPSRANSSRWVRKVTVVLGAGSVLGHCAYLDGQMACGRMERLRHPAESAHPVQNHADLVKWPPPIVGSWCHCYHCNHASTALHDHSEEPENHTWRYCCARTTAPRLDYKSC